MSPDGSSLATTEPADARDAKRAKALSRPTGVIPPEWTTSGSKPVPTGSRSLYMDVTIDQCARTPGVGTTSAGLSQPQVAGDNEKSAPGRIRTFAPASGGRCSIP